ncbi:histidine phosphatase family protein [Hansschlegelia quercus]
MICALRSKRPVFPGDNGPDEGLSQSVRPSPPVLSADRIWCGPDAITRRSAAALGLDAKVRAELSEIDFGSWRGRTLDDVAGADPGGFQSWTTDPSQAAHGGESIEALLTRAKRWLAECERLPGRTIAVAPASVLKACMLHVFDAPARSFFCIDVEPLSSVVLSSDGRRWALRVTSEPRSEMSEVGRRQSKLRA